MTDKVRANEQVLADIVEDGERRRVKLVDGESLALCEESCGPLTQFAYGADVFGHKMLFDRQDCARAYGVDVSRVFDVLVGEFARTPAPALLSDVMDRFDRTGTPYAYASWSGNGDAVFRAARA